MGILPKLRSEDGCRMTEEYIVRVLANDDCITEGELIRCRECKWWKESRSDVTARVCAWDNFQREENDFCSWARRLEHD